MLVYASEKHVQFVIICKTENHISNNKEILLAKGATITKHCAVKGIHLI